MCKAGWRTDDDWMDHGKCVVSEAVIVTGNILTSLSALVCLLFVMFKRYYTFKSYFDEKAAKSNRTYMEIVRADNAFLPFTTINVIIVLSILMIADSSLRLAVPDLRISKDIWLAWCMMPSWICFWTMAFLMMTMYAKALVNVIRMSDRSETLKAFTKTLKEHLILIAPMTITMAVFALVAVTFFDGETAGTIFFICLGFSMAVLSFLSMYIVNVLGSEITKAITSAKESKQSDTAVTKYEIVAKKIFALKMTNFTMVLPTAIGMMTVGAVPYLARYWHVIWYLTSRPMTCVGAIVVAYITEAPKNIHSQRKSGMETKESRTVTSLHKMTSSKNAIAPARLIHETSSPAVGNPESTYISSSQV